MGQLHSFAVVAQSGSGGAEGSGLASLLLLVALGAFFYFFLIRPQRKRVSQMRDLHQSLEVGDDIRTVGGIFGRIERLDDEEVTIDVGGGTRLRISRQAVAAKVGGGTA